MNRWSQVGIVARWEFRRFVKLKQQMIGVVIMVVVGAIGNGMGKMADRARNAPVTVGVVGSLSLPFVLPAVPGVTWDSTRHPTADQARAAVSAGELDAVLVVSSPGSAELVVKKRNSWTGTVEAALTGARREAALAALRLDPAAQASLAAPFSVTVSTVSAGSAQVSRGTRIVAAAVLMSGLLMLVSGFASLFAGITGEKQQRITEQMIAMVAPQTWMDGKIIGLTGAACVGTGLTVGSGAALLLLIPRVLGKPPLNISWDSVSPGLVALVTLVTALGVVMWFSFMAAVAATIDDPNASPRAPLLLLPLLPVGLAFSLLSRAESPLAQGLSMFPLTSMAVLPIRVVLTSVPWWEPVVAIVLLAVTAWGFRLAAGKIFAVGVLMHGKEPSLRETLRWLRTV